MLKRTMTPVRIFAFMLAVALAFNTAMAWAQDKASLTLLHINDVYEIAPNKDGLGGFAPLMTLVEQERQAGGASLLTFGGDLLSPSILSGITKGRHMIEFMNAIGTDVAVLGNHEFDFGPEILAERIGQSRFSWLGANVDGRAGPLAGKLKDNVLISVGGFKVGVFGVITGETQTLSSPRDTVKFGDYMDASKAQVAALKAAGADVILALTHLAERDDREVAGLDGVDAVLGGHDHEPYTFYDGDIFIHKSGSDAHFLGVVKLVLERKDGRSGSFVQVTPSWKMIAVKDVDPDPEIQAIVERYEAELDGELNIFVGDTRGPLDSRKSVVRSQESSFGNLVADALKWGTKADAAFTNGGGIRADREYEAGARLTRRDILSELPFGNVTVLLEMRGADIKAALEHGVSGVEDNAGRFLQVSGINFTYDPAAPAGQRVRSVTVNGEALEAARTYKVATNDYIAKGGDGFAVLKDLPNLIDASGATFMATMVMDYIAMKGTVDVGVEGRVRVAN